MTLNRYDVTAVCERGQQIHRACTHVMNSQDSCSNGNIFFKAAVFCDAEKRVRVPDWCQQWQVASGKGGLVLHY